MAVKLLSINTSAGCELLRGEMAAVGRDLRD